ncbi:hypothetical protein D7Z94_03665 [Ulvibacterium marinum]|uniref:Uncharacterized protein n=2 Tax=Ulvibacterium marinum TaxID=2419782 RepID=A0A3B0CAK9_9FLAO|nr:hypothetical protein D7Z94_03665 [Ulvibacterium marinum]
MNFKREYNKVWKEMVKSEAWKNSLLADRTAKPEEEMDFYTSILDVGIDNRDSYNPLMEKEVAFEEKYSALVSRAYFKIIAEAEKADYRLRKEYEDWNTKKSEAENKGDKTFKRQLNLVNRRYAAHQKMLKGLKSWNILSEYRSDDLRFFKNENRNEVQQMFNTGKDDSAIVNLLIYKLADLYHFED